MICDPWSLIRSWIEEVEMFQPDVSWSLIDWLTDWQLFVLCVQSLRRVGKDSTVLLICVTVFLSYLPEAGQYSSFFLYLRQVTHTRTHTHAHIRTHTGLTNVVVISLMSCVGLLIIRRCHWKNGLFCVSGDRVFSCSHRCLHRHGGNPLYSRSGTQTTIWRHLGGFVKQLLLTVNDLRVRNKTCSADKEWATVDCRDFLLLITTKKVSTFHHCLIKILFN